MVSLGGYFDKPAQEGWGMIVPLDTVNGIRSMDAAGLLEIFLRWGRVSVAMMLDNATETGRMVRGEVAESTLTRGGRW